MGQIFESSFLINLFEDKNIARIFYKSSQSYQHANRGDEYLETEYIQNNHRIGSKTAWASDSTTYK